MTSPPPLRRHPLSREERGRPARESVAKVGLGCYPASCSAPVIARNLPLSSRERGADRRRWGEVS
jgi:hypothetical protein